MAAVKTQEQIVNVEILNVPKPFFTRLRHVTRLVHDIRGAKWNDRWTAADPRN